MLRNIYIDSISAWRSFGTSAASGNGNVWDNDVNGRSGNDRDRIVNLMAQMEWYWDKSVKFTS